MGLPPNPHLRILKANSRHRDSVKAEPPPEEKRKVMSVDISSMSLSLGSQVTSTSVFSDMGFSLAGKQMFIKMHPRIKPWTVP